jgi:hypothetical protein
MPFGAHSVAVIEGGIRPFENRHRASLRIHFGAQALTCPVVAPVRPRGLTLCLIAQCASVANPVWHPYSERHSGTMGAPLRPERTILWVHDRDAFGSGSPER